MVELHDERRKPTTAVDAGLIAECEQQVASLDLYGALRNAPRGHADRAVGSALGSPFALQCVCANGVAIRTDDVTLRDLGDKARTGRK